MNFLLTAEGMQYLGEVFNLESSSNIGRMLRSLGGLMFFFEEYEGLNIYFGNSNLFNETFSTGAESEWVNHLLNLGIVGVLIYFIPLVFIFLRFSRANEFSSALTIILIFLAMIVYRHTTGVMRGALFWFYIFCCFDYFRSRCSQIAILQSDQPHTILSH